MIVFDHVTLTHPHMRAPILNDVNLAFHQGDRVGILAAPGSGKSSIARLFSGVDQPTHGAVHVQDTSWPLGFAGFLHPHLTVRANLNYIAKLTGQVPEEFTVRVCVLAKLSDQTSQIMRNLTPTQRAVLAYMCTMVTPAKTLIADDTLTVGDTAMRSRCDALLGHRLKTDGLIFLSRNVRQVTQHCDRFFALTNGRLVPCSTAALAQTLATQETEYA